MTIRGNCSCKNIEVMWHTVDHGLVPRACQCSYCKSKGAAYVSKSGTKVEILIKNEEQHKTTQHGSKTAVFHECKYCSEIVFVSAEIDGSLYCALNANILYNKYGFSESVETDFSNQTQEQKRVRWSQNWCQQVLITS